ncbi:MAG: PQQ-binding-like beta-propeller repeat protein [Acidimicrobiia bacterium]
MQGGKFGAAVTAALLATGVLAACSDDGDGGGAEPADAGPITECDWPMWGYGIERSFSTTCSTGINPRTAGDLRRRWFFNAEDVVTATPAVVGDTVYTGDWAGVFYALDREDGTERWRYETEPHANVYSGQIVSSPAVADISGERTVYFGGGKTLYALRAKDGSVRWSHELGTEGDPSDPTEIESSPVVVEDGGDATVIVGWDVHNSRAGEPAGVVALDATNGDVKWETVLAPTEGDDGTGSGCGDVWGSPTVDVGRGLVFAGTGDCPLSPEGWGRFAAALVALDLESGEPVWSYQPRGPNNDDFDFAGAPNLFGGAEGTPLVGLGNKDAVYYAVERDSGELVWRTQVTEPGLERPGTNFSTGGFIGGTAYADSIIVGGTAVGGSPFLHALDAETGDIRWQADDPAATYAAAAEAGGVVFIGGTDFTFRALDLRTGEILWSEEMMGAVSGGAAIAGDDVVAVAGIREPGLDEPSRTSGVYLFSLAGEPVASSTTTAAGEGPLENARLEPPFPRECVDSPCEMGFDLKSSPEAPDPQATLTIESDPFTITVEAEGLGTPQGWLRPGSPAAEVGATVFGVFISDRDDDPNGGGLVCVLDDSGRCSGGTIPRAAPSYNRITIVAMKDARTEPTLADGFDRLVSTISFDPPLRPTSEDS